MRNAPNQGATVDTPASNACLAAAPNLVLVVMLGTGTEGQSLRTPPTPRPHHSACRAPKDQAGRTVLPLISSRGGPRAIARNLAGNDHVGGPNESAQIRDRRAH